ncbi:kelch-like protein 20 isoform X1, partial [Aphis craccivora]
MNETIMENSACESNNQPEVITFKQCEQKTYKNSSHIFGVFEVLQSLRKDKVLCDIRIETDDGTLIFGHKNVLVSASTYFREIFACCNKNKIDHIRMRELDSSVLQLLINYIYTGEILVS